MSRQTNGDTLMIKVDAAEIFRKVCEEVRNDPETAKLAEEYERLYGRASLTAEALKRQFTI